MSLLAKISFAVAVVIAPIVALAAEAITANGTAVDPWVVPGELIVGFAPGAALAAKQNLDRAGFRYKKSLNLVSAETWTYPLEWN